MQESSDFLSDLPGELHAHIAGYLISSETAKLLLVSKRLNDTCTSELYRTIALTTEDLHLAERKLHPLLATSDNQPGIDERRKLIRVVNIGSEMDSDTNRCSCCGPFQTLMTDGPPPFQREQDRLCNRVSSFFTSSPSVDHSSTVLERLSVNFDLSAGEELYHGNLVTGGCLITSCFDARTYLLAVRRETEETRCRFLFCTPDPASMRNSDVQYRIDGQINRKEIWERLSSGSVIFGLGRNHHWDGKLEEESGYPPHHWTEHKDMAREFIESLYNALLPGRIHRMAYFVPENTVYDGSELQSERDQLQDPNGPSPDQEADRDLASEPSILIDAEGLWKKVMSADPANLDFTMVSKAILNPKEILALASI